MQPLIFKPILIEKIWGGSWLKKLAGKVANDEVYGEAIIYGDDNALYRSIDVSWDDNTKMKVFNDEVSPLMIKLLDAQQDLSVQVHPLTGNGKKTEAWYIIDADENAEIIYGLKGSLSDFKNALLSGGNIEPFLNKVKVKAGDFVYLPSGIVHALGKGIKVLEIQQNSNITYRLYDYNRGREIHVNEGLKNIDENINYNTPTIQQFNNSIKLILGYNNITSFLTKDISEISNKVENDYSFIVTLSNALKIIKGKENYIITPYTAALVKNIKGFKCKTDSNFIVFNVKDKSMLSQDLKLEEEKII